MRLRLFPSYNKGVFTPGLQVQVNHTWLVVIHLAAQVQNKQQR